MPSGSEQTLRSPVNLGSNRRNSMRSGDRRVRNMRKPAAESYYLFQVFQRTVEWAGFREKLPEASNGKARIRVRAFHKKLERRIQLMILLPVKIRSIAGRLTALIVWTRKGRR
jgi:hypothetical protein